MTDERLHSARRAPMTSPTETPETNADAERVRRLRDAEDQIEIMMLSDTQSKIVNALLKLAQRVKDGVTPAGGVAFTISPMELSTRVGLDVDTVKRGVQQLREGQYIRVADE